MPYAICQPGSTRPIMVANFYAKGDDAYEEPFTVTAVFETKEMALNCLFNIESNRKSRPGFDIVEVAP